MIEGILWVVFTVACILVSGLILLQEGKGGGLGEAFGGAGAQTFGVKAQGVAKFTGGLVCVILLCAVGITRLRSGESGVAGKLASGLPAETAPATDGSATVPTGDLPAAPADAPAPAKDGQ